MGSVKRFVWVLNLGVEDEFAGRATQTTQAKERAKEWGLTLADLVTPEGTVIEEGVTFDGAQGRAFCPTPSALAVLSRAGAELPTAPAYEVLRRVNHRAFLGERACSLPGATLVTTLHDAVEHLARPSLSGMWVAKRPFGFAGRGHRRFRDGEFNDADRAWLDRTIRQEHGVLLEPWVNRVSDHAIHGYLSSAGQLTLGTPTAQHCDDKGRWQSSTPSSPNLDPVDASSLARVATEIAEELLRARYFGPFGIDAYRWREPNGAIAWQWVSDLNARYSMGWALGMGKNRPDLEG